jgi:hypothetical protein
MDPLELAVQAVAGDLFPDDEDYSFSICSPEFCTDEFRMYDFKVRGPLPIKPICRQQHPSRGLPRRQRAPPRAGQAMP